MADLGEQGLGDGEQSPGDKVAASRGVPLRGRTIAMILVFDVGGPLLAYFLLHAAGLSTVLSLVLSGVFPAFGVAFNGIQYRRLDIFGVLVLAGIVMGSVLGLTTHNARLYLVEGSVPSAVFSAACLVSLRARQPLIYRIALELVGLDTPKGREIADAWQYPGFRRAFRIITVVWGVGYLIEAGLRMVIAETTSTGIALVCSKVAPYVFAISLAAWTMVYGEREKRKAERGAVDSVPADSVPADSVPADSVPVDSVPAGSVPAEPESRGLPAVPARGGEAAGPGD